jgi:hypothetical protein
MAKLNNYQMYGCDFAPYEGYFSYEKEILASLMFYFIESNPEDSVEKYLSAAEYHAMHGKKMPGNFRVYMQAPFQPFLNMRKDAVDTFKPYKSSSQVIRDFLQPLKGLQNIIKGLCIAVSCPYVLLCNIVGYLCAVLLIAILMLPCLFFFEDAWDKYCKRMNNMNNSFLANFVQRVSWMMEGLVSLIRGMTQIAAAPFTWLIKMPLRAIVTYIKGAPAIEKNRLIIRLAEHGHEILDEPATPFAVNEINLMTKAIHVKFRSALKKGQHTDIAPDVEYANYYAAVREDDYPELYISLDAEEKARARAYLEQFAVSPSKRKFLLFSMGKKNISHSEKADLLPEVVNHIGRIYGDLLAADNPVMRA